MTKQTKEAAKKVAKQQQTVEAADKKHPITLMILRSGQSIRLQKRGWLWIGLCTLSFLFVILLVWIFVYLLYEQIMPEIKVDKERLAADDAKQAFWQAITKLKSLETSFKKSLNDEGNKSSWCEEGFFEEGEEGKFKDQLTSPQDAIFRWQRTLFSTPKSHSLALLSSSPPTAEEVVDDGDYGGGSVADSNG